VFIPPQADRQMANRKAGELLALGVSEFFIVNDGPQQFAISLGVFSREEGAQSHLAKLREKGVRSARVGLRNTEKSRQHMEVKGDAIDLVAFSVSLPEGVTSRECR
jgi:cell division septation protein DedD